MRAGLQGDPEMRGKVLGSFHTEASTDILWGGVLWMPWQRSTEVVCGWGQVSCPGGGWEGGALLSEEVPVSAALLITVSPTILALAKFRLDIMAKH